MCIFIQNDKFPRESAHPGGCTASRELLKDPRPGFWAALDFGGSKLVSYKIGWAQSPDGQPFFFPTWLAGSPWGLLRNCWCEGWNATYVPSKSDKERIRIQRTQKLAKSRPKSSRVIIFFSSVLRSHPFLKDPISPNTFAAILDWPQVCFSGPPMEEPSWELLAGCMGRPGWWGGVGHPPHREWGVGHQWFFLRWFF